jgi:hypothetical protein
MISQGAIPDLLLVDQTYQVSCMLDMRMMLVRRLRFWSSQTWFNKEWGQRRQVLTRTIRRRWLAIFRHGKWRRVVRRQWPIM